jgi:hypothetical protein
MIQQEHTTKHNAAVKSLKEFYDFFTKNIPLNTNIDEDDFFHKKAMIKNCINNIEYLDSNIFFSPKLEVEEISKKPAKKIESI